jgi:hypothetical protein
VDHLHFLTNSSLIDDGLTEKTLSFPTHTKPPNFVRLSLCSSDLLMQHAKDQSISNAVILRVDLQALLRPDVLFANGPNAGRSDHPTHLSFELIRSSNALSVADALRKFSQAEILLPSPIRSEFIRVEKDPSKCVNGT